MLRSFRRKPKRLQGEPTLDLIRQHFRERTPEELFVAAERAFRRTPDDAQVLFQLLEAASAMEYVAIWIVTARRWLKFSPNHPQIPIVRDRLRKLEKVAESHPTPADLAARHEWTMWALAQGQFEKARELAEAVRKEHPEDIPSLNNLTMAYNLLGKLPQAISTAQSVLAIQPHNVHALANLVRLSLRNGQMDEAADWGRKLRSSSQDARLRWTKKAEAFSYLGWDEAVLDCYRRRDEEDSFLTHLAAVAMARGGDWNEARKLWKSVASLGVAQENLQNATRPAGERNSPWPFALNQWLDPNRPPTANELKSRKLAPLVPVWLDRGDPVACELAVRLAGQFKTPELLAFLKDFALSQRGSDRLRLMAGRICREEGLLGTEPVTFWQEGEWKKLSFLFWTIDWMESETLPRKVRNIRESGLALLQRGQLQQARVKFLQGLELCPESPSLANNLAVTFHLEGETQKSLAILRELHRKFPDYSHARLSLASEAIAEGHFALARELIEPVMQKPRLHVREFALLCEVQLQLAPSHEIPASHRDGWKRIWEQFESTEPDARELRPRGLS